MDYKQGVVQKISEMKQMLEKDDLSLEQKIIIEKTLELLNLKVKMNLLKNACQTQNITDKISKLNHLENRCRKIYSRILGQLKIINNDQMFFNQKLVYSTYDKEYQDSYPYFINQNTINKIDTVLENPENKEILFQYFSEFKYLNKQFERDFQSFKIMKFLQNNLEEVEQYYNLRERVQNLDCRQDEKWMNQNYDYLKKCYDDINKYDMIKKTMNYRKLRNLKLKLRNLDNVRNSYHKINEERKELEEELQKIQKKLDTKKWFEMSKNLSEQEIYKYFFIFYHEREHKYLKQIKKELKDQVESKFKKIKFIENNKKNIIMTNLLKNNEETAYQIYEVAQNEEKNTIFNIMKLIIDFDQLSLEESMELLDPQIIETYQNEINDIIKQNNLKKIKVLSYE